jgi:outer membrane murein-binding lipoprotein Lpp
MQRGRRLALVAVLFLVGGLALAGCRSQPGVAAYVGSKQYSVKQVEKIVKAVNKVADDRQAVLDEATRQKRQAPDTAQVPSVRTDGRAVAGLLVLDDVAARLVKEKGLRTTPIDPALVAGTFSLDVGSEYVRLWASFFANYAAIRDQAPAVPLTDEQVHRYYDAGVAAKAFRAGVAFDLARQSLANDKGAMAIFAAQGALDDAARRFNVSLNPRYGPLSMPVLFTIDQQGTQTPASLPAARPADAAVRV